MLWYVISNCCQLTFEFTAFEQLLLWEYSTSHLARSESEFSIQDLSADHGVPFTIIKQEITGTQFRAFFCYIPSIYSDLHSLFSLFYFGPVGLADWRTSTSRGEIDVFRQQHSLLCLLPLLQRSQNLIGPSRYCWIAAIKKARKLQNCIAFHYLLFPNWFKTRNESYLHV